MNLLTQMFPKQNYTPRDFFAFGYSDAMVYQKGQEPEFNDLVETDEDSAEYTRGWNRAFTKVGNSVYEEPK
jgi:hypothetical protein